MDLDAILSELLEIENQLSSEASSQFILGLPTLSAQSLTKDRQHKSSSSSSDAIDSVIAQSPGRNTTSALTFRSGTSTTTDKLGLEQHQPTSTILVRAILFYQILQLWKYVCCFLFNNPFSLFIRFSIMKFKLGKAISNIE